MADAPHRPADARQELVEVIRQVRSRWRMRILLQGGVIILVGALVAIALASFGLQTYKFSPQSVTGFRIAVFAAFAALLLVWLVRPMRRRVTDLQVALYVEEHEPKLQAAILAAVDIGGASARGETPDVPAAIVDKLVAQAIEKCRTIEGGRAIGRIGLRRAAVALGAIATVGTLLLVAGPEFLRQGASALLVLSKSAEAASPYAITVLPGDVKVPKGSDQAIHAKLAGFRSNDVGVWVRAEGEDKFSRVPLVAGADADKFEGMLFDVKASVAYYVEADGVKSPTYAMKVVELPAVAALEMEYVYPAYTGLPPQKIEVGGDVAAHRRHGSARQDHVHDEDRRRAAADRADVGVGSRGGAGRHDADRQLQDSPGRLLPRGTRRAGRRKSGRVAQVHGRRDRGSRADRVHRQAEARHPGQPDRGSVHPGARAG